MIRSGAGMFVAMALAGTAQAADLSPVDIVNRHAAAAAKGDLEALIGDYAENAVVLQAGRTIQGKAAIRGLYAKMMPPKPAAAPAAGAPARPAMKITRVWQEGDVGLVTWEMGPVHATEEFLVRGGKIEAQAVFMNGAPPSKPQ